jgi:hypothetical protein
MSANTLSMVPAVRLHQTRFSIAKRTSYRHVLQNHLTLPRNHSDALLDTPKSTAAHIPLHVKEINHGVHVKNRPRKDHTMAIPVIRGTSMMATTILLRLPVHLLLLVSSVARL